MDNIEAASFVESLSLKLYGFCQNQLFCDTLIVIENPSVCKTKKTFWAHSVVLAAASADLCSEFLNRSDFTANGHSVRFCLPLPDCDPVAVEVVLRYLYTGKLVVPAVFHEPEIIARIFEVCKSLGVPLENLHGVELTISNQSASISPVVNVCSEKSTDEQTADVGAMTPILRLELGDDNTIAIVDSVVDPGKNFEQKFPGSDVNVSLLSSKSEPCVTEELVPSDSSPTLNDVVDSLNPSKDKKCYSSLKTAFEVSVEEPKQTSNVSKLVQHKGGRQRRLTTSGRLCNKCGVMINPPWKLLNHQRKCHLTKTEAITCPSCTRTFSGRRKLHYHQRDVHGVHCCRKCDRQFQSVTDLDKHHRRDHVVAVSAVERPYVCDVCGKSFSRPQTLVQHINTVHSNGARPYLCDLCGASFASSINLRHHIDGHKRPYVCERCGRGFRARHLLREHVLACQTGNDQPFQCNDCGVRFTSRNNLHRHELSHRGHSVCSVCGRSYSHKQSLDEHMRLNHRPGLGRADPANQCSICGKMFTRPKFLEKHTLQHEKSKRRTPKGDCGGPHSCTVCGRGFSHRRFLANHAFVHQQHKLLKCGTCGKEFTHRRYLTMHALVHREVKYSCPVVGCSKQFPFLAHVVKHSSHVHGLSREDFEAASSLHVEQYDEDMTSSVADNLVDISGAVEYTIEVSENNRV